MALFGGESYRGCDGSCSICRLASAKAASFPLPDICPRIYDFSQTVGER